MKRYLWIRGQPRYEEPFNIARPEGLTWPKFTRHIMALTNQSTKCNDLGHLEGIAN